MKRQNLHCKTFDRPRFTAEQGKLCVNLFADENLRKLAQFHYVEGKTLEECAEVMMYSVRHIERMHTKLKNIAIAQLMNLVSEKTTETKMKLLKIKNIICQGDDTE